MMVPPIPTPRSRVAILVVLAILAALLGLLLWAADVDAGAPPGPRSIADIEAAMVRLVQPHTSHPVIAEPAYRAEIAQAISNAGKASKVPELFLAGLFYRESSFAKAVVQGKRRGALGEKGLGQLGGGARYWCTRKGLDLHTIDGQAHCSAAWLDYCRSQCNGSLSQGLAFYATGRTCDPRSAGGVVRDRMEVWRALETGGPIPPPPSRSRRSR